MRAEAPLVPALAFLQRLWALNHALERLSQRMEKRYGITAQQRFIIRCVHTRPGMTAGELAATLNVDPGTVSAALRRLEQKKLIVRLRDEHDGRKVTPQLTKEGIQLTTARTGTVEAAVDELLLRSSRTKIHDVSQTLDALCILLEQKLPRSRK